MINHIFLSEVLATRLSHDLIGNIGAVANAVELLNEGDAEDSEDIRNILNFSSSVLSKRLKFFRLCFGLANASVKDTKELEEMTSAYLSTLGNPNFPISLDLQIETPKIYKFILPAVMLMADTIIKGGKIAVKQNDAGIHISAISDMPLNQTKFHNIDLILEGKEAEENPSAYAPLYYLLEYLADGDVAIHRKDNTLIIGE